MNYAIRDAHDTDFDQIWEIFHAIVAAGETYAYDPATDREAAYTIWMRSPQRTLVAAAGQRILATYYIKPNQPGLGSHVCNCGYMVAEAARGQGIAGHMCAHSQVLARDLGYRAMQYNLVVASNTGAIRLWQNHGFAIVGRLPGAFQHRRLGYVDAFVMYKTLVQNECD